MEPELVFVRMRFVNKQIEEFKDNKYYIYNDVFIGMEHDTSKNIIDKLENKWFELNGKTDREFQLDHLKILKFEKIPKKECILTFDSYTKHIIDIVHSSAWKSFWERKML